MGQKIMYCDDKKTLIVTLVCDGGPHLLKEAWSRYGQDYALIMKGLRADGWRRIHGGQWRGPCCP